MSEREERVSEGEERVRRGKSGGGQVSAKVSSMHFLLSLRRQGKYVSGALWWGPTPNACVPLIVQLLSVGVRTHSSFTKVVIALWHS